ncbi:MFS transporter [Streptomyces sp. SPB162]|uniref:MFS transporter n=1 Tax=Streptomyces sp. SPB162 TaxID=2940560 RepID=UPI0024064FE1|nr:MFS transporter [Streptomyces sp. SPB162]MDF9815292.1 MFS family permease [Streptomyces sp. SPB162]
MTDSDADAVGGAVAGGAGSSPPREEPPREERPPAPPRTGETWPHFGRLWTANAVSALGDGVRNSALPLLAFSLTENPVLLSLTTIVTALGMMMAPIGGVWADLYDRRALLIAIDLCRFVVVGLIALGVLTDTLNLVLVYIAAGVLGMGESIFLVTSQAFLPQVVAPEQLTRANGRLHAVQVVLRDSIGQPLGGVLFAFAAVAPFLLDGASFLLGLMLLLLPALRTVRTDPAGPRTGWWQMVREGMRYLRSDRLLMRLAVVLGVLNFFTMSLGVLMVLYVVRWLHLPQGAYGFFLAANAIGGVAGGLSSDWVRRRVGVLPGAVLALAVMGVSCLLIGGIRSTAVAAVSFGAVGFGIATWQTLITAFRQTTIPHDLLGRVNGAFRMLSVCVSPFGAITAGVVAEITDINVPIIVSGCGILLLTAVSGRSLLRMGAQSAG